MESTLFNTASSSIPQIPVSEDAGIEPRHCDLRLWRWQSDLSDRLCFLTHWPPFLGSIAFSVDMQPTSLALANPVSHTLNYTVYTFPL
jgi:hypothetical protein